MQIGRIDVDGIDPASASHPACRPYAEPTRTGNDVGNRRPVCISSKSMTLLTCSFLSRSGYSKTDRSPV
jgi:hypothetical protein